jgi:hypothetical protein
VETLIEAIEGAPRSSPELWPGGRSMRFAYTAMLLSVNRTPPWAESLLGDVLPERGGTRPIVPGLGGFIAMDDFFLIVRLPGALKLPAEERKRIRERIRAGVPAIRREFLAGHMKAMESPHRFLAVLCTLALSQEACPEDLPSERPYRWEWDNLDLYKCKWPDDKGAAARGASERE